MDGQDLCRSGGTVYQDQDGNDISAPAGMAETNPPISKPVESTDKNKREVKTNDR